MTVTKVFCHLADCHYFRYSENLGDRQRGICDCTHPEKPDYMDNAVCPLYKKKWAGSSTDVSKFKRRNLKKG